MKNSKKDISPGEYEIMQIIWKKPLITVKEIHKKYNENRESEVVLTTVLKNVQRLEEKGWIFRKDNSRPAQYCATEAQETVEEKIGNKFLRRFFGGSVSSFVRALVNSNEISDAEKQKLRQMLE